MMDVAKKIQRAIVQIILKSPFFAAGLLRLKIQYNKGFRTMAVDADGNIYINPDYVQDIDDKKLMFVLLHELCHCIFLHIIRQGNRNEKLWDLAIDMATNKWLSQQGFGNFGDWVSKLNAPDHLNTAEEFYQWLEKNKATVPSDAQFDVHIKLNQKGKNEWDEGKQVQEKHTDIKKIEEEWKGILTQILHSCRMQGTETGGLEEICSQILESRIPWYILLQQYIQSKRKCGSTWLPPNKKYLYQGIILPSYYEDFLKLAIIVDTSGSISSRDLQLFLGSVNDIIMSVRNYEILLLQCDTKITDERTLYTGESLDTKGFEFKGRGGTDFRPAFERLNQENDIDLCLFLTDGQGNYPEKPPQYPVLWVLVEDYDVPFGEKIIIEED